MKTHTTTDSIIQFNELLKDDNIDAEIRLKNAKEIKNSEKNF